MKWVLTHLSADHLKWLLQDAVEQSQFTYNVQHHSIRIRGKNNRLFFLDIAGIFQKKMVLRSEYGVALGETPLSASNGEGTICISDFRFFYRWQMGELQLFSKNRELLSTAAIEATEPRDKFEQFALLFSHAWLVYSNLVQKKDEDLLVA